MLIRVSLYAGDNVVNNIVVVQKILTKAFARRVRHINA